MRSISIAAAAVLAAALFQVRAEEPAQTEPTREELVAELKRQIAGREQEPAEAVFKDIQLMKGRTAEQLLATMEMGFSRSLGVNCTHCHDPKDWAADAKPQKAVTREMILMTREINAKLKTIEGIESDSPVANCTTCHRGKKKPAVSLD